MTLAKGLAPLLVLSLLLAGCSGDSGGGTVGVSETPAAPAKPLLKYRFEQGRKSHYLYTSKSDTKTGMGDISQEMIYDVLTEVQEVTPEGAAKLTYTYDRARTIVNNPMMGVAEYDSQAENAEEQAQNPQVLPAVALHGAVLTLTQNPDGSITDLSGMDAVVEKLLAAMGDSPDAAAAAGMMKAMFSDEAWGTNLQQSGLVFPSENPEPGTVWTRDAPISLQMLGEVGLTTTCTFVGSEEKDGATIGTITYVAKLDVEGFKPPEPDPSNPMAALLTTLKITSGDTTGTATFDMDAGQLISNESDLKLTMEMMGMPMENALKSKMELVK